MGEQIARSLAERNRRLLNYKRVSGYVIWDADFPRTASLKIRRVELAEQIRKLLGREAWCRFDFLAEIRSSRPNSRFFAVVNPAAGGGRCGKLAGSSPGARSRGRHRPGSRSDEPSG